MGPIMGGVPRMKFDASKVAITFDGNSHVSIIGSGSFFLNTPADMGSVPIANTGIGGRNWAMMNGLEGGSSGPVDASYVPGKVNILIAWEGTNTLRFLERTPAQAWGECLAYCNARQAYVAANRPGQRPWVIVLGTCLPLGQSAGDAKQQVIYDYNTLMVNGYRAAGISGLFDVRAPESVFAGSAGIAAMTSGAYAYGDDLHSNTAGYTHVVQDSIIPALKRLRMVR